MARIAKKNFCDLCMKNEYLNDMDDRALPRKHSGIT